MLAIPACLLTVLVSSAWCQSVQRTVVPLGDTFSFDCQRDESVYFGQRLDNWSEIQEDDENYQYLNLKFNALTKENVLRVTSSSVQSQNAGYYACRKATWTSAKMNRIYELALADVQSFYWTYVCHGPAGSCLRSDDAADETRSTIEIADQTRVDLYCCASATGYSKVNVQMSRVGEERADIDVKRKQELDGSWVVCANQHTLFKRTAASSKQQVFTCELFVDDRSYSTLHANVAIKDGMAPDVDDNPSFVETTARPRDRDFFNRDEPSSAGRRRKLSTGKQIALILGAVLGGLALVGFVFCLICVLVCCMKKKPSNNSQTNTNSKQYASVNTYEKSDRANERKPKDEESTYIEPTPLYENAPVFLRL